MKNRPCQICGEAYCGYGHNAQPIVSGLCCSDCNVRLVLPARMAIAFPRRDMDPYDAGSEARLTGEAYLANPLRGEARDHWFAGWTATDHDLRVGG